MSKGKKHTPEQIVRHLRDAEAGLTAGRTFGQICRHLDVKIPGLAAMKGSD
jgi:hypothetical protein